MLSNCSVLLAKNFSNISQNIYMQSRLLINIEPPHDDPLSGSIANSLR